MSLGTFLRDKRKSIKLPYGKKVSLSNIAELIPCTKSYLWDMEQDKSIPSLRMAARIAKVYHITLNQMARESICEN